MEHRALIHELMEENERLRAHNAVIADALAIMVSRDIGPTPMMLALLSKPMGETVEPEDYWT